MHRDVWPIERDDLLPAERVMIEIFITLIPELQAEGLAPADAKLIVGRSPNMPFTPPRWMRHFARQNAMRLVDSQPGVPPYSMVMHCHGAVSSYSLWSSADHPASIQVNGSVYEPYDRHVRVKIDILNPAAMAELRSWLRQAQIEYWANGGHPVDMQAVSTDPDDRYSPIRIKRVPRDQDGYIATEARGDVIDDDDTPPSQPTVALPKPPRLTGRALRRYRQQNRKTLPRKDIT